MPTSYLRSRMRRVGTAPGSLPELPDAAHLAVAAGTP